MGIGIDRKLHDDLAKALVDSGKLIEAGFVGARDLLPKDASDEMVAMCRLCYLGGAQHLFASIMAVMDSDRDPTAADLKRMSMIDAELRAASTELEAARLRRMS